MRLRYVAVVGVLLLTALVGFLVRPGTPPRPVAPSTVAEPTASGESTLLAELTEPARAPSDPAPEVHAPKPIGDGEPDAPAPEAPLALLHVVDATTGAELEGLVVLHNVFNAGGGAYPNEWRDQHVLVRGASSPLELEPGGGLARYWVHAVGYGWASARFDPADPGERTIPLEPASTNLSVVVRGGLNLTGELYVRVVPPGALDDATPIASQFLSRPNDAGLREAHLRGVPPGHYDVRVERGRRGGPRRVLDVAAVGLAVGEERTIELALPAGPAGLEPGLGATSGATETATLTVRVTVADTGEPADLRALAWRPVGGTWTGLRGRSSGVWRIEAPVGTVELEPRSDLLESDLHAVELSPDGTQVDLQVAPLGGFWVGTREDGALVPLAPWHEVTVTRDGAPVEDARRWPDGARTWFAVPAPGRYEVSLGPLEGYLPNDPVTVDVFAPVDHRTWQTEQDDSPTIEFELLRE